MRFRVDLAPLLEARVGFCVESVKPDVQMSYIIRPLASYDFAHCCVGLTFERVEIAVKFFEPGQSLGKQLEV